ncbi:amylo-alpha-1,6-glucosidase [Rhizocola hellebori]|uniref:Amylo-alpha-1,6-glucosidase n=1 Tax=Rhizocola hellebori TaxID=1392758 RepID=A0A8J3QD23_9ACTN|nr:glycogen debranching N-terminal domain-containing protein [Rhizocola hellebori]GIH08549.1 amylo-alpha-1,6-glucosidase [Rhizocola hellebori]
MTTQSQSTPFNTGEPVPVALAGRELVTMVEGTTFCICMPSGDIEPGTPQGLFFRDSRVVSRWQLRLDGLAPQSLSVANPDSYHGRFVLRRPPSPGQADSTLLVIRRRIVGAGMKEVITLSNVGREATMVRVELQVAADFADLFAVKEGRAAVADAYTTAMPGSELVFSRTDGSRGLSIHATREPQASPVGLTWEAVIPPRQEWSVEVLAQPVVDSQPVEPRFRDLTDSGQPTGKSPWLSSVTTFKTHHAALGTVLQRSLHDLDALRMESHHDPQRVYMAAGAPWFMTLFGRDSLLTAWMVLPVDPSIAIGTLHTLAALQGKENDPHTEEQPGRILHESRLGPDSVTALGGRTYYGTIDATPLFVALLGEAWRWGADEADIRALLPAADRALSWMERYGDRDGDGFLEYQRATDRGLANQGWKDSWDGVTDASGRLADPPIALAEVQGYAYAAWLARAEIAESFGDRETASACRERAGKLKQLFAEHFWVADGDYPALALDGHKRQVDSLTSNAAQAMWSGIVSDEHATRLVERLSQADMDSGFGLRTLSEQATAYNPMSYHNGSVWPHDTALGVAGLMRYAHIPGAVDLAHRLADGLIRAAMSFEGRLPELYCGFESDSFGAPIPYPTSCSPQAWASAAPFMLVRSFLGLHPDVPRKHLRLTPDLPAHWGSLSLDRLTVAGQRLRLSATQRMVQAIQVPDGWTVE